MCPQLHQIHIDPVLESEGQPPFVVLLLILDYGIQSDRFDLDHYNLNALGNANHAPIQLRPLRLRSSDLCHQNSIVFLYPEQLSTVLGYPIYLIVYIR